MFYTKENTISTYTGKGTTPKATNILLAKGLSSNARGVVNGYIDCYNEWILTDLDAKEWASNHVRDIRGMDCDERPMDTIRINIGYIAWAEDNVIGGACACPSMAHIIATKKGNKPVKVAVKAVKVGTVLVDTTHFDKWAKKNKVSSELVKSFKSEFALR